MKRISIPTILALAAALVVLAVPAQAQDFPAAPFEVDGHVIEYVEGELLVGLEAHATADDLAAAAAARGCSVTETSAAGYYKLSIPEGASAVDLALEFAADAGCSWASPNFIARTTGPATFPIPPNDPFYGFQTHLQLINMEDAWTIEAGDPSVVVSVIDSGIAYEDRAIPAYELPNVVPGATQYLLAPDMAQTSFVPGFDFIHNDAFANDDRFHGTGVAAVIAQSTNNGVRTAGIAPGVTLMPVKSNNFNGSGTLSTIIDSIVFSTQQDVDVINMSLGFPSFATDPFFDSFFVGLDQAIQDAHAAGVVLVAATGNDGSGLVSRPAANPLVIAVGATNLDGLTKTFYSQDSTQESLVGKVPTPGLPGSVELVAPVGGGEDLDNNGIPDAVIQETIAFRDPESFGAFLLTGTSFSSPQVAGVAALLISNGQRPGKDGVGVEVVRQILRDTAVDLGAAGPDLVFGAGQVDAFAALSANQVTICKRPPGNPANAKTKRVGIPAARAHLATGSTLGPCP